jgi:hypothetical protein
MTRVHERVHLTTSSFYSPPLHPFLLHRAPPHTSTPTHASTAADARLHQPHRQSSGATRLHQNYFGWPSRRCYCVWEDGSRLSLDGARRCLPSHPPPPPPRRAAGHNPTLHRSRRQPPTFPVTAGLDRARRCLPSPRRPHATIPRRTTTSSATATAPSWDPAVLSIPDVGSCRAAPACAHHGCTMGAATAALVTA